MQKKSENDTDKLFMKEFPLSIIQSAYKFYHALQDSGIVDIQSSKTKTCFGSYYKP